MRKTQVGNNLHRGNYNTHTFIIANFKEIASSFYSYQFYRGKTNIVCDNYSFHKTETHFYKEERLIRSSTNNKCQLCYFMHNNTFKQMSTCLTTDEDINQGINDFYLMDLSNQQKKQKSYRTYHVIKQQGYFYALTSLGETKDVRSRRALLIWEDSQANWMCAGLLKKVSQEKV